MPTDVKIKKMNKGVGVNRTSSPFAPAPADATRVHVKREKRSLTKNKSKRKKPNTDPFSPGPIINKPK